MIRTQQQLQEDAIAIWQAGVQAVRGDMVVRRNVEAQGPGVRVGDAWIAEETFDSILVVGGGKACASMVTGLEVALEELAGRKRIHGWVNVPDETVRPTRWVHLHAARPSARNLPTEAARQGAEEIMRLVDEANSRTWIVVLISGGGSALLPLPIPGLALADKVELTQLLSAGGADIVELNAVRRSLSRIKAGGLLRAARGARLDTLVISDVLGDPIESIASGPTVWSSRERIAEDERTAGEILERFRPNAPELIARVEASLAAKEPCDFEGQETPPHEIHLLANLAEAIDAAGIEAERRGYAHAMTGASGPEGDVREVARHWVRVAKSMLERPGPDCWISGGEPTVQLAPVDQRGRGGRNQQLVMEAWRLLGAEASSVFDHSVFLSGGTDGEDGPTDAAGAFCSAAQVAAGKALGLDVTKYCDRNDGYAFFEQVGGLLKTGPTDTNVCDLRVVVLNSAALREPTVSSSDAR